MAPAAAAAVAALARLSLVPAAAKRAIRTFLEQSETGIEVPAPEAKGYGFQSHGVIEMLEGLLDKPIDERTGLEKEEMNTKHAYDMLMQDLTAQIVEATSDRTEKAETKGKPLQAKSDATGELTDGTTRDAGKVSLTGLTTTFEQKATDFELRQEVRAEELESIQQVIDVISSGAVSVGADDVLPALVQTGRALARRVGRATHWPRGRSPVPAGAPRPVSRVLSMVAVRVATELRTNEQTRKEETTVEAIIAKRTEASTMLTEAVAALDPAIAEAMRLRTDAKAENEAPIADAKAAEVAVSQALEVLKAV